MNRCSRNKVKINIVFLVSLMLCICFLLGLLSITKIVHAEVDTNSFSEEYLSIADGIIKWKKESMGISETEYLFQSSFLADAGSPAADWYAIALGRLGYTDDYSAYLAILEHNIKERYKSEEKLDTIKATEWHRIGLAVLSCGGDPTYIAEGSINLPADGTYDRGKTMPLDAQGINGLIWGLIFVDGLRYEIPNDAYNDRDDIIIAILENQQADGGFGSDGKSSVDITVMALQALAPYYNSEEVYQYQSNSDGLSVRQTIRTVLDKAVKYISGEQLENGGFTGSAGKESCETNAQAIIALCTLGINPQTDERFVKSGRSPVDALLDFRQMDGGFAHSLMDNFGNITENSLSDDLASQQTLLALTALVRYEQRMHTIYDFRPEANDGIKQQIIDLDDSILLLDENYDKAQVEILYNDYLVIPETERSSVRNYSILADAMQALDIPHDSGSLVPAMNMNQGGTGYIISLFDGNPGNVLPYFTDEDAEAAYSLNLPITEEETITVIALLGKLEKAGNRNDHRDIELHLNTIQMETERRNTEIEIINILISELYPIEDLSLDDYDGVYEIITRVTSLEIIEQDMILGKDDLFEAKTRVDSLKQANLIKIIILSLLLIVIVVVLLRLVLRGRIRNRNRNTANKEE